MIYLDSGATSFRKPETVYAAVARAMRSCSSPGRGGYGTARCAQQELFACREQAASMFDCQAEQVVFTTSATHGLNIAIRTLIKPGSRVVISGFEHNAVTRPLHALEAKITVAGRKLFDWDDTLHHFEQALRKGADAAVFTCVSNVFGYILPVEQMARLCQKYEVPFILDAAQGAGTMKLNLGELGAEFIAMPGHKGLLGPQGTGLLLCRRLPEPLIYGGTGSLSRDQSMPDFLPDRAEAGTLNVPGIAGLSAGLAYVEKMGPGNILLREQREARRLIKGLEKLGLRVFSGENQCGTVSFLADEDCEDTAEFLARQGIAVRAGLHCAPVAHQSAGTLESGTVRVSFGHDATPEQTGALLCALNRRYGR
jgi:selenocysteine lyase/cysteine desulfurase